MEVRGRFGIGKINENGENPFNFYVMNELYIMDKEEHPSVYLTTSRNQV